VRVVLLDVDATPFPSLRTGFREDAWPPTGDGVALTVSSRIDDAGDAQGVAE